MEEQAKTKITEKRNPVSTHLDEKDTKEIIEIINEEEATVADAVARAIPAINGLVEAIVPRMKKGGRLFYVGAGTSGRMGIIDAVECVPTFSLEEDRVIGILAGGREAMFNAREGIEDSREKGQQAISAYEINELDTVLGVAASGSTPYVIGAVEAAGAKGALTGSLVCNYDSGLDKVAERNVEVIVGSEVLTGSTRMKAGTAQKMILNLISTSTMVKMGKVYSNLMVDLKATNQKLRNRARGIVMEITEVDVITANEYLTAANYEVKKAIIMITRECSLTRANELLEEHEGDLRSIIG